MTLHFTSISRLGLLVEFLLRLGFASMSQQKVTQASIRSLILDRFSQVRRGNPRGAGQGSGQVCGGERTCSPRAAHARCWISVVVLLGLIVGPGSEPTWAQEAGGGTVAPAAEAGAAAAENLNFLQLLLDGGFLMIPILLMSFLLVTFTIERLLGLRTNRVLPSGLVRDLGQLSGSQGSFDPRQAYRVCQQYPSAAANVVRAMLLKVGRPHSEVEHTVTEASEREAARLYANVRWLNLAAAVTPLMGLLGTVWGMIQAFHDTTQMMPGQNKADYLAEGIYIALVTTLAGLMVAIPAAIFAHYFEGRIQSLFIQIDELLFNLMPQIERYEGRVRFGRGVDGQGEAVTGGDMGSSVPQATAAAPVAAAPASAAQQAARRVSTPTKPASSIPATDGGGPRAPVPAPAAANAGLAAPPVVSRRSPQEGP